MKSAQNGLSRQIFISSWKNWHHKSCYDCPIFRGKTKEIGFVRLISLCVYCDAPLITVNCRNHLWHKTSSITGSSLCCLNKQEPHKKKIKRFGMMIHYAIDVYSQYNNHTHTHTHTQIDNGAVASITATWGKGSHCWRWWADKEGLMVHRRMQQIHRWRGIHSPAACMSHETHQ